MLTRNTLVRWGVLLLGAAIAVAQQNPKDTDRGVKLKKQPGNVTYDVELTRGANHAIVQPNFQFQTGDRFSLRVRVASDSYVYVLNRTFVGSPDELRSSRQIRLVPDPAEPTPQPAGDQPTPTYSLVYPPSGNRLLRAGQINRIPGSQMALEMDENPGVEQLVLVVSPKPLDIASMFNPGTGEMKGSPKDGSTAQRDSAADVYSKLRRDLAEMARNSDVEEPVTPTRSWTLVDPKTALPVAPPPGPAAPKVGPPPAPKPLVPTSVAAPKAPKQPFLVEIILAHYPV